MKNNTWSINYSSKMQCIWNVKYAFNVSEILNSNVTDMAVFLWPCFLFYTHESSLTFCGSKRIQGNDLIQYIIKAKWNTAPYIPLLLQSLFRVRNNLGCFREIKKARNFQYWYQPPAKWFKPKGNISSFAMKPWIFWQL